MTPEAETGSQREMHTAREIQGMCELAARRVGADGTTAALLAEATVEAELRGRTAVGLGHFFDYLEAMTGGRLDGMAAPVLSRPAPALIVSDAVGGLPHVGFFEALEELVGTAGRLGVAIFSQRNAYTCGELGWFVDKVARRGLVCLAVANSSPAMAAGGSTGPVLGTNPWAFAAPGANAPALLVDQASSQTAFVSIREAAAAAQPIPAGWGLDKDGEPTTDAAAALSGALLPFGGYKGGNIAWIAEILATLSGANWSVDAPPFNTGPDTPGTGLFVLALEPTLFDAGFHERLEEHLNRLASEHSVRLPGRSSARGAAASEMQVPEHLMGRLRQAAH